MSKTGISEVDEIIEKYKKQKEELEFYKNHFSQEHDEEQIKSMNKQFEKEYQFNRCKEAVNKYLVPLEQRVNDEQCLYWNEGGSRDFVDEDTLTTVRNIHLNRSCTFEAFIHKCLLLQKQNNTYNPNGVFALLDDKGNQLYECKFVKTEFIEEKGDPRFKDLVVDRRGTFYHSVDGRYKYELKVLTIKAEKEPKGLFSWIFELLGLE